MDDLEILKRWLARARAVEKAHFRACVTFRRRHYIWGGSAITLAAIASAITGVAERGGGDALLMNGWPKFFRILLAISVPVAAAVVTFLNYQVRSNDHHREAAKFAAMKRKLDLELSRATSAGREHKVDRSKLASVCKEWDELTEHSPALYEDHWEARISKYETELGLHRSPAHDRSVTIAHGSDLAGGRAVGHDAAIAAIEVTSRPARANIAAA